MSHNLKRDHAANKISIQIFGGMGDVLAITPSLKALKQQEPNRKIVVYFVSEDHRRLLENNPHIDEYKKVLRAPSWLRKHQLLHRLFRAVQRRVQDLTDPQRVSPLRGFHGDLYGLPNQGGSDSGAGIGGRPGRRPTRDLSDK